MYIAYTERDTDHMIVTGHPKIDVIVNSSFEKADIISKSAKYLRLASKKVILWTPNIGEFGGDEKWELHYNILETIIKLKDIFVIFRPHPMQLAKLKDDKKSDDLYFEKFKNQIMNLHNVILDESPSYIESFVLSDGLITCTSSIIFEYLVTQKPILYTPQDYKTELNDDGNVIEYLYIGDSKNQIENFFLDVLNERDILKQKRLSAIPEYLYSIDGKSGKRIRDYVVNELTK